MLKPYLTKLLHRKNLSASEMTESLEILLAHDNPIQASAFLSLLHAKGETAEELYTVCCDMQKLMRPIDIPYPTLDIVGTGGDGFNTVNISTASAILAASCGVKILKHGNRAVSSLAGSADLLAEMGFNLKASPDAILTCIEKYNFGFCYAPNFHPALKTLKSVRSALKLPTMFNLVGPLLNPARAQYLMLGVANPDMLSLYEKVLLKLNIKRAFIFNCKGLDELCCAGEIDVIEINQAQSHQFRLNPTQYGLTLCTIEDLRGGDAKTNANLLNTALQGKASPIADTLCLNAGVANYLYGLTLDLETGIDLAKQVLNTGKPYELIQKIVLASQSYATSEKTYA